MRDAGLTFLWSISGQYAPGERQGANLRFVNYAKELAARNHKVYCLVDATPPGGKTTEEVIADNARHATDFFERLKDEGAIAGYYVIYPKISRTRGTLARLAMYPGFANKLRVPESGITCIRQVMQEIRPDVWIIADRRFLFATDEMRQYTRVMIDWVDCLTLHYWRGAKVSIGAGRWKQGASQLLRLVEHALEEEYYGKRASLNLTASPADKKWLDALNGRQRRNRVLLNGSSLQERPDVEVVRKRIIFTGVVMSWWPNHWSAIWFIDRVLPLILRQDREVQTYIVGSSPRQELLARASSRVHITGFVEDLASQIAKSELYVAPMVCGGGFNNQVIEALSLGAYIVGTSIAFEFLDEDLQRDLVCADTEQGLADTIIDVLHHPHIYEQRQLRLTQKVREQFSWERRALQLADLMREPVNPEE